jgi:nucleoside-diphosphate-sugar epimerase
MGRKVRTVAIPENAAYVLGWCAEWWTRLSGKPGILSRDKVLEACCAGWVCDPGRARRELGFCASTDLEEGLRRTLDWYKEAGWLKF